MKILLPIFLLMKILRSIFWHKEIAIELAKEDIAIDIFAIEDFTIDKFTNGKYDWT